MREREKTVEEEKSIQGDSPGEDRIVPQTQEDQLPVQEETEAWSDALPETGEKTPEPPADTGMPAAGTQAAEQDSSQEEAPAQEPLATDGTAQEHSGLAKNLSIEEAPKEENVSTGEIGQAEVLSQQEKELSIGNEQQEKNVPKKRRLPIWAKILIGLAAAVCVVLAAAAAAIAYSLNQITYVDTEEEAETAVAVVEEFFETEETTQEEMETIQHDEITWENVDGVYAIEGVTNILLIGADTSSTGTSSRSDSMIIVTINSNTGEISLTSLMRDMYVQIPGYSDNRLNAAYTLGGMELLAQTVETNFAIQIDGCVAIDFSGFKSVINALGGVDIELTAAEAKHLNNKYDWELVEGVNHLTGAQALAYARIRKVGDNDYERTQRQRVLLSVLFEEFKDIDLVTMFGLVNEVLPYVSTDMTSGQILGLAVRVLSLGADELGSYRIPADGMYTEARVYAKDGTAMEVLIPDLQANIAYFFENACGMDFSELTGEQSETDEENDAGL